MKNNKRPILMVLRTPPPYGGGEIRSAALSEYISSDPDFIVQEISSPKRNKTNQGFFAPWKLADFLKSWWQFIWLVRQHRPRLVFYPLAKSFPVFVRDSFFYWTARFFKVPFASELPGATFYFLGKGRFRTWYGKFILSKLVCLRVLGKSVAQNLARFSLNNLIISDNGIKYEGVKEYSARQDDGAVWLVFMGTHSPQKGFDQLVEASIILAEKGLNFKVHALGEWGPGQFQKEMSKVLREHGIESRFFFHGLVHGNEKWAILSDSQILVLPSVHEGQPLVILEALACGMPVVASRVGAIPDTIEDGINGFLISPHNSSELADKLETLMMNSELRQKISTANRQLYETRFTQQGFLRTQTAWLKACASGELIPEGQFFSIYQKSETN